jgi:hypothetical protein
MKRAITPPIAISKMIDRLDVMREELLSIQRSLEKVEIIETVLLSAEAQETESE